MLGCLMALSATARCYAAWGREAGQGVGIESPQMRKERWYLKQHLCSARPGAVASCGHACGLLLIETAREDHVVDGPSQYAFSLAI